MNVLGKFAGILLKPRETFSELGKEKSPANAAVFFALAVAIGLLSILPARIEVLGASAVLSTLSLIVGATAAHVLGKLVFRIKAAGYRTTLQVFLYWGAIMNVKGTVESLLWTATMSLSQNMPLPIESVYPAFIALSILIGIYLLYVLAMGLGVAYGIPVIHAFIIGFGSLLGILYFSAWATSILQGMAYG